MTVLDKTEMRTGFAQCQQNAFESIKLAWNLFQEKYYRPAVFFALLSIEEVGKGLILFESFNAVEQLTQDDLRRKGFFKHPIKLETARDEYQTKVQTEYCELLPDMSKVAIIGLSPHDFEEMWKLRNDVLFVDFDFNIGKWKHPQKIIYSDSFVYGIIEKAQGVFKSFENSLHKSGHDTFLSFS